MRKIGKIRINPDKILLIPASLLQEMKQCQSYAVPPLLTRVEYAPYLLCHFHDIRVSFKIKFLNKGFGRHPEIIFYSSDKCPQKGYISAHDILEYRFRESKTGEKGRKRQ